MLKDKSCFKTSTGDEAGSAPKHGVVTSKIKGKANFCAWSMDVKFEGENVPRHLDITLHNEASLPANTPTWPYLDAASVENETGPCEREIKSEKKALARAVIPMARRILARTRIVKSQKMYAGSLRCATKRDYPDVYRCCDGTTGHHVIPLGEFCLPRSQTKRSTWRRS